LPNFGIIGKSEAELSAAAAGVGVALRVDELQRIAHGLGRDPTTVELYAFDAQWSEHCSYKSSRHHLRKLPTQGPDVVIGPGQDAGVVRLGEWNGERYCIVIAHESHNHPSQVVPFEGAATGVGGIVRDVLCMGAEVVAIADALRFGNVTDVESHQRYVATGVVDGISSYGNAIGVPNIAGDAYFDDGFSDNCLVNVIALGIVKEHQIIESKAPPGSEGWDIVLVGKATDASGFGGAAFSSLALDAKDAQANKSAVQVPDPFLKNVIMRASYRVFEYLREREIFAGFKDLGAGGIMGCTAEICAAGGYGAIIDLDEVVTSQEGLPPAVIAIGETQERLLWILPPHATADVLQVYNREFSLPEVSKGACARVIGAVQANKRYIMRFGKERVMDVDIDFLTGAIKDELPLANEAQASVGREPVVQAVSHPNRASRDPLFKQYDAVVRGATVIARGHAAAGVMMIPNTGLAFALSTGGNPGHAWLGAEAAAELAVHEAVLKVMSVGARPVALTDCLNFGNPKKPAHYAQLVSAIDGLARAARELNLAFVSGNVSLYNEGASGKAVPASAIVSCIGTFADFSEVLNPALQSTRSFLFLLPGDSKLDIFDALTRARAKGAVLACGYVEPGPVSLSALRMAFAQDDRSQRIGIRMERSALADRPGLLVEVQQRDLGRELFGEDATLEARTDPSGIFVGADAAFDSVSIEELLAAWRAPLAKIFG